MMRIFNCRRLKLVYTISGSGEPGRLKTPVQQRLKGGSSYRPSTHLLPPTTYPPAVSPAMGRYKRASTRGPPGAGRRNQAGRTATAASSPGWRCARGMGGVHGRWVVFEVAVLAEAIFVPRMHHSPALRCTFCVYKCLVCPRTTGGQRSRKSRQPQLQYCGDYAAQPLKKTVTEILRRSFMLVGVIGGPRSGVVWAVAVSVGGALV